jgi:hypothetical protein
MTNTELKAEFMTITPSLAAIWLQSNTKNYRKISRVHVKNLKSELTGNVWMTTCQGIGFDTEGTLVDGQNRLTAIVESGVTVEDQLVCFNLPVDSKYKIDVGRKRNLTDHTGIHAKVITTVRVPFRALGNFNGTSSNLTFMQPYLNGKLGKLAQELYDICSDTRGITNQGIRAGLVMAIMGGKITKAQGLSLFKKLAKLRKNNDGQYLERSISKRRQIQSELPNLLMSLIEKIEQGITPVYDDKTAKFVDATDVREQASKIMFLAIQAFDTEHNHKDEFSTPSHTLVSTNLNLEQ